MQRTSQQRKKKWWPLLTAPQWKNSKDAARYLEIQPLMHHIVVASKNVSSVALKTRFAIIGSKAFTEDTFNTLWEIEQFMNAWSIANFSSGPNDLETLTLYHFLGRLFATMHPRINSQPSTLIKQWQFVQQLSDHVWNCLLKEFIPDKNMVINNSALFKWTTSLDFGRSHSSWIMASRLHRILDAISRSCNKVIQR